MTYENMPYNGRFTFARIRFKPSRWGPGNYMWGLDLKWNHDYPRGGDALHEDPQGDYDARLPTWRAATSWPWTTRSCSVPGGLPVRARLLDDRPTKEAAGLRAYLLKGGFLIVDDFAAASGTTSRSRCGGCCPRRAWSSWTARHPVFDSFFRVDPPTFAPPLLPRLPPGYWASSRTTTRRKRLLVIVNYNQDISEYWEWSDTGFVPIDLSNEAYKLGVNYVMYAMTH